jgi:transketolase
MVLGEKRSVVVPKTLNKPSIIIANTIPGKGVSFMEGDYTWHGKAPNFEESEKALIELKAINI